MEPRQYGTGDGGDKGVDTEQTGVINPMFANKNMKSILAKILIKVSSLMPIRDAERTIMALENRIGIGSGGGADQSGESIVFEVLSAINKEQLTVFDVGANKGQYSTEAVSYLSGIKEFTIYCFEPSEKTFQFLSEAHSKNSNVILNNFGFSDKESEAILYTNAEGSGLASLTKRKLEHFGIDHGRIQEKIKLVSLDDYGAKEGVKKIHLLKIDVEGHELDVLAGAKALLESREIDLVQFEFGGCNIDTRTYFQDFFYFFDSHGFDIFRILPSRKLLRLPTYREIDEKFRTANYLAANKSVELTQKCCRIFVLAHLDVR